MWLIILSDQLWIDALVGRYPTNKLIQRGPIPGRPKAFPNRTYAVLAAVSSGYSTPQGKSPRVTHPCASLHRPEDRLPLRLACVRPAASVRSEPGSNSQVDLRWKGQRPSRLQELHHSVRAPLSPGHCPSQTTRIQTDTTKRQNQGHKAGLAARVSLAGFHTCQTTDGLTMKQHDRP